MFKSIVKKILKLLGVDYWKFMLKMNRKMLSAGLNEQGYVDLIRKLREIVPDISDQGKFSEKKFYSYYELKSRGVHAFQCRLMLKALENYKKNRISKINVVDIGDSAGTHMIYLKNLMKDSFIIDSLSINLDPKAIKKIRSKGVKALLCRAEELDLGKKKIDLFTSFEMVEHLHNPAIFFRRLAKKINGDKIVVTLPYRRKSRVGLHYLRNKSKKKVGAGTVHIFELCPGDWANLMLHSGWRIVYSKIYYQYPRKWLLLSKMFAKYWEKTDYEGFWGAILEKDLTYSELYLDWEE